jgi:hypothetical protein
MQPSLKFLLGSNMQCKTGKEKLFIKNYIAQADNCSETGDNFEADQVSACF